MRLLTIALLLLHVTLHAQMSLEQENRLTTLMAKQRIPGLSICIITDGEISYSKGFGMAKSEEGITTETLFQVASLSKTYAAALALLNAQNGVIDLDKPINTYLTSYHIEGYKSDQSILPTLRQILNHTAGINISGFLGYKTSKKTVSTLDMVLEGKKTFAWEPAIKVEQPVNGQYQYSGGGYCLLQKVLEEQKGNDLNTIVQAELFNTLGMAKSFYGLHPSKETPYSYAHDTKGKSINGNYRLYPQLAAAGLWSTPTEYAELIIEYMNAWESNGSVFTKESINQLITPTKTSDGKTNYYGLGVMVKPTGEPMIMHTGRNFGFSSYFAADLKEKSAVIVFSNKHKTEWKKILELLQN